MIDPKDMKIGVPVLFSEMLGWANRSMGWCSQCGATSRYPKDEVHVIRHWKRNSTAGTWRWYCPDHFAVAREWENDHLAPAHLLP